MKDQSQKSDIQFLKAAKTDLNTLESIRKKAFRPIFDSFRNILGNTIYEHAQLPEDLAQEKYLRDLFEENSIWETWKVEADEQVVGFISIRLDAKNKVGEIGLNAIDPDCSGKGFGTEMYQFALAKMKHAGMKVATVATGGDPAHLPARKAYQKAGFTVEIPSVWMCQELE